MCLKHGLSLRENSSSDLRGPFLDPNLIRRATKFMEIYIFLKPKFSFFIFFLLKKHRFLKKYKGILSFQKNLTLLWCYSQKYLYLPS